MEPQACINLWQTTDTAHRPTQTLEEMSSDTNVKYVVYSLMKKIECPIA